MAISVVGTVSAASTSLTPTTHAVGDYIVIYAFRSATTAPTLPAGYTNIVTSSGNSNSFRIGYKVATSTTDASGTWTNASGLICTVYRGVTAIGASNGTTKAAATTATIAALTLLNTNANSWAVAFAQHAATSTQGTPLAGATTVRATLTSGTFNAGLFDTNAGVTSFAATTSSNTTSVVSSGGVFELIAAPAVSTLTDAFNQTILDTSKWGQFTAGSATMTYASTGAQVNYPAVCTAATDGDITSNSLYSLIGSQMYAQILSVPSSVTSADAELWFRTDGSNWLRWVVEGGTLFAQYQVAGSTTTPFSVAYSAVTHLYWQILETGGNTIWQTSPDGTTWTTQATVANTTHGLRIGSMLVGIAGVCFQAEANPGTFKWNNFNTQGVSTSVTQVGATITAAGGIQTIDATSSTSLTQTAATVTATGGTQAVVGNVVVNASVTQVGATITATGGTQSIAAAIKISIAQVGATITATGGTQAVATVRIVSITQVGATVTATGGTQVLVVLRTVAVTQVGATVTATGGVPAVSAARSAAITVVKATLTVTPGTMSIAAAIRQQITQVGATLTVTPGTIVIATQHGGPDQALITVERVPNPLITVSLVPNPAIAVAIVENPTIAIAVVKNPTITVQAVPNYDIEVSIVDNPVITVETILNPRVTISA